jgi:hypothetical protein
MAKRQKSVVEKIAGLREHRVATDRHGVTFTIEVPSPELSLFRDVEKIHQLTLAEWWRALWEIEPPACPIRLGKVYPWPRSRRPALALFTSLLFHFSVVYFLYTVAFSQLFQRFMGPPLRPPETHTRTVSYVFRRLSLAHYLPTINQSGPGGAPGEGSHQRARHARKGSTHYDPRVTIISNPEHPENFRVTIQTPLAPPEVKAPKDVRVPDLILGGVTTVAESVAPTLPPLPTNPAPVPPRELRNSNPPPKPPAPPPPAPEPLPLATKLPPIAEPQLEVPAAPKAKPVREAHNEGPRQPQEPPHAPASPPAGAQSNSTHAAAAAKGPEAPKLTTLSVDPIPLKDLTAIPVGNRAGAFAISPAGREKGSLGGVPGGEPEAGKGGHGPGGDHSVAVGKGDAGGGGKSHPSTTPSVSPSANPSTNPTLSVSNRAGAPSVTAGTLAPLEPGALVYSVDPAKLHLRATGFVVSSGPGGGGGLRAYGVLHGKRIYTVYLAMPGKNWILQFCARDEPPQPAEPSLVVQMHIEPPLTPPSAIAQFDFHRPTEINDLASSMIILHGIIREDGAVSNMEVQQGLEPALNDAALAAFSHWKFNAALRNGSAVAVEILVGIPAVLPGS